VPPELKDDAARVLGSPIARATRIYGGFAPSATFRLVLRDRSRAFFKGIYPPKGTGAIWMLDEEERIYRHLGDRIAPWAPKFLGSVRHEGWHAILLEDLGPTDVPPWTPAKTRVAARSYADFHRRNLGSRLPRWLPQRQWRNFSESWAKAGGDGLDKPAALARRRSDEAREWLDVACSAYRLPFRDSSARAIVLFDVFHHLERPVAALTECARVLARGGRVIIFDVYVSWTSFLVYLLHPERVRWRAPIDLSPEPPARDEYYTGQRNATRMFFTIVGRALARPDGLKPVLHSFIRRLSPFRRRARSPARR